MQLFLYFTDQSTFGGFIVMSGERGAATLRIPFYGWKGAYEKLHPIIDLTIGTCQRQKVCMRVPPEHPT